MSICVFSGLLLFILLMSYILLQGNKGRGEKVL